jgi:hypothetical protein
MARRTSQHVLVPNAAREILSKDVMKGLNDLKNEPIKNKDECVNMFISLMSKLA